MYCMMNFIFITQTPPPPLLHAMDHNNTDIEGGEENFTVSKKNLTMI